VSYGLENFGRKIEGWENSRELLLMELGSIW
jgi:hypothetical protein